MRNHLTVVMYHFVRDMTHSKYPDIKGLHLDKFRRQLEYIQRYYIYDRHLLEEGGFQRQGVVDLEGGILKCI